MADATTTMFPEGTEVKLYPHAKCEPWKAQATLPPFTATDTQTSDGDSLTSFTGLTAGLYYAVGTVEGTVRFVTVQAPPA